MSEYGNLAKNTVIFAIGQFSVKIIQFFLMPILTIALTTEDYGSAESLASLAELVIPLFTLGLQDAVFRFCMRENLDKKAIFSSTMAVVVIGTGAVAVATAVANVWFSVTQCIMFFVIYIGYSLTNIFGQYLRGNGYIKTFAASGILQALLLAVSTAVFVYLLRWGAFGYMLSMSTAYICSACVMFIFGKMYKNLSFRAFDKSLLKDMLKYSLPLIPNAISWWFMQVVNRYIVIGFLGNSAAGIYIASSKIATVLNIFGTIFLQAWTISTVNSLHDENKGEFNTKIFRAYGTFIQMAAFGIMLILPILSSFLLKGEFFDAWKYSSIAIFTAVLSCYASFFGAFYGANMKTSMVFISTLVGAVVNTLFCFLFVWLFGLTGALYANMLGYFVLTVIRIITTKKYSLIRMNLLREIGVILILFIDALAIALFNVSVTWRYYVVHIAVILLFSLISFKEIKTVFAMITGFCKRFVSNAKSKKITESEARDTQLSDNDEKTGQESAEEEDMKSE